MLQQGMDVLSGDLGGGVWAWLTLKASVIGDFGSFVFFKFVLERLQHDIRVFGEQVLGRMMDFISVIAIAAVTIWVFIQGYKVVTGTQRESMMGLTVNALKAVFIVSLALSFGAANDSVTVYLTEKMPSGIHELVTGNSGPPSEEIDRNLGWMQVAMSSLDALDAGEDVASNNEKARAQTWIGLGTAGPAITAGALLLMYQVAMALFVGLGPLFILCLLFDFTKSLFSKWLFYGIGTMFSMAVLSAMVSIALAMVTDVAAALWASDVINSLVLQDGGSSGYTSRAMQSGSMGMILTLLLITVPPMAANFFSGTLGQFTWASAFGVGAASAMGPGGQAPGTPGYQSGYTPQQPGQNALKDSSSRSETPNFVSTPSYSATGGASSLQTEPAGIRQGSPLREQPIPPVGGTPALDSYRQNYADKAVEGQPTGVSASGSGASPPAPPTISQSLTSSPTLPSTTQSQTSDYMPAPPTKDSTPEGGRQGS